MKLESMDYNFFDQGDKRTNYTQNSVFTNVSLLRTLNDEMFRRLAPTVAVLVAVMVVGTAGNIVICYIFSRKLRRSSQYFFLLCLGLFDLLSSCVGVPSEIFDIRHYYLYESAELCKAMRFLTTFPSLASILVLLAIAADRYRKICKPLHNQIHLYHARIALVIIIVVALAFSVPAIYIYGHRSFPTPIPGLHGYDCSVDDAYEGRPYPLVYEGVFLAAFLVCTIVLVFIYARIWLETRRHIKYLKTHATFGTGLLDDVSSTTLSSQYDETTFEKVTDGSSLSGSRKSSKRSSQGHRPLSSRFHRKHKQESVNFQRDKMSEIGLMRTRTPDVKDNHSQECLELYNPQSQKNESESLDGGVAGDKYTVLNGKEMMNEASFQLSEIIDKGNTPEVSRRLSLQLALNTIDKDDNSDSGIFSTEKQKTKFSDKNVSTECKETCNDINDIASLPNLDNLSTSCPTHGAENVSKSSSHKSDYLKQPYFNSNLDAETTERYNWKYNEVSQPEAKSLKENEKLKSNVTTHRLSDVGNDPTHENSKKQQVGLNHENEDLQNYTFRIPMLPETEKMTNNGTQSNRVSFYVHSGNRRSKHESTADFPPSEFRSSSSVRISRLSKSSQSSSMSAKRARKALRATRTTIIAFAITTGFILSYLPHLILIILRSVKTDFEHHFDDTSLIFYNIFIRSYFANNVINIFVYGTMNVEFRTEILNCWKKLKCRED